MGWQKNATSFDFYDIMIKVEKKKRNLRRLYERISSSS